MSQRAHGRASDRATPPAAGPDPGDSAGALLRRNTDCLATLAQLIPDGIALIDGRSGQFLDFNETLVHDLGYAPGELAQRTLYDVLDAESREHVRPRLAELTDDRVLVVDVQQRSKDGRCRPARLHARRLPAPQQNRLVVVSRATSPHHRITARVEESEEMLRLALEAVGDGLWDWHLPSDTFTRSPAWCALTGYTAEELESEERAHGSIIHPDDRFVVSAALTRHLDGRSPAYQAEFRIRHKSGEWRWLLARGRVVQRDLSGMPVRVMGTDTDITARKVLEEQLRESHRMEAIGQLAAGVAHDFNNILTAVLGNAELLRAALAVRLRPGDPLFECINQIERAGERAATLTRQLLTFSRRQVLEPRLLDVNAVLGESEKLLRRLLPEHVELRIAYAPALRRVRVDAGQLEQMLIHLIIHGRDRMPGGGALEITTRTVEVADDDAAERGASFVQIQVSDTGPALDPEVLASAFDPRPALDAGRMASSVGLATVHGIVAQAGGRVTAEDGPDGGAILTVMLPAQDVSDGAAPQPDEPVMSLRGTEAILVCEDDPAVRHLTCRTLEGHGYRVLSAESAAHALELYERRGGRVDALLTDIVLPGMTGRSLAEQLISRQPDLRVLYVSGYSHGLLASHGASTPGPHLLPKPFTARDLLARLRQTLDEPPAHTD